MSILKEIHNFAKKRFERQESIIIDEGFEDLKFLRIKHAKILGKIVEMHENLKLGRIVASEVMKSKLLEWRINHTSKMKGGGY